MKNFGLAPDFKFLETEKGEKPFRINFVCSFSDMLRELCSTVPQEHMVKVHNIVKQLVAQFDGDPVLKDSLMNDPRAKEGNRVVRQVDYKAEGEKIILKAFVGWHFELKMWHVMLEFPSETFWEDMGKKRNDPDGTKPIMYIE